MSSYLIEIDEDQREALLEVLENTQFVPADPNHNPLEYWIEMLKDLPKNEAETPRIIHGFCL